MDMKDRYARALRRTAPKIAASTPGAIVEGYWLDDQRYYFAADRFEPALGRLMAVPSIANRASGKVEEAIPLAILASLLGEQRGEVVEFDTLSSAVFDMPGADTLGVSLQGRNYLVNLNTRRINQSRAGLPVPALYSPDGRYACFVKDHDLWLRDRASAEERPLTSGGMPHRAHGLQTETCLAALTCRKQPSPLGLWSPDSQWFLTHRIDERDLSDLPVVQHAPPGGGRPMLHTFKYAVPGDPLPMAVLLAMHVPTGRAVCFEDFPTPVLSYSPFSSRTVWFEGEDTAFLLRTDRYFRHAELIRLDLAQGTGRIVLSETTTSAWLEFHQLLGMTPNVRTLSSGEVIWYSERDGWAHLYLYASDGRLKNRITEGAWLVRDIVHVDEEQRRILFTACGLDPNRDPVQRVLCSVHFDGSGLTTLRSHDGDIAVPRTEPCGIDQSRPFCPSYAQPGVAPGGAAVVARYTNVQLGNVFKLIDLESDRSFALSSASPQSSHVLPQTFSALAADGVTRLHGTLFFPGDFDHARQYPLIDYIYPGPQTHVHPQSFAAVSSAQAEVLAELGCVSLMLDTRGMPFRSKALHQAGYGHLAEPQLADHAAVIQQLCERHPFIDRDRIGILGQSGGGYAAARAMFDYASLFKVGVAVCGNHDSNVFSALWSDKHRGPGDPATFAQQANAAAAHKLRGKLMLISGDMDENVHVGHTLTLADALVRAHRDFDLLIVPNEGHLILMTNGYVQRRIWDYFVRHLLGETPPEDFEIRYEPFELSRMTRSWIWEWRL
jgi:dipeptidyl-peptidase 4